MKHHLIAASVGTLGILSVMGLGCNPVASLEKKATEGIIENAINKQTGGQAKVDLGENGSGAVTFKDNKTGDYSSLGEGAKIPDGFPTDLPQYPGAKTVSVSLSGTRKTASLMQTTTDGPEKVILALKTAIKAQGFTEASTITLGDGEIVSYEKGTIKITLSVGADSDNKETSITLAREEE